MFNAETAIRTIAMRCLSAAKARDAIVARCAEMREAGVTIGDARSKCPLALAFLDVFKGEGLKPGTASNYLAAVRRAVNDGLPFDLNPAQTAAKQAKQDGEETAEETAKGKRTPMSFAERLRRVANADEFSAFAAFADKLAKTGTPIATIVEQYVTANA